MFVNVSSRNVLRLRPHQRNPIIDDVMSTLVGPEQVGDALWRQKLVQMVLDHDDTPRHVREAALLVKSPEMAE